MLDSSLGNLADGCNRILLYVDWLPCPSLKQQRQSINASVLDISTVINIILILVIRIPG